MISQATVYTAELYAIKTAVEMVENKHLNNVVIYSDSRSAIEAIKSYINKHSIVLQIRTKLHEMKNKRITITLCWIPSHVGIQGNEDADKAAKEAIGIPNILSILPIEDWLTTINATIKNNWQNEWSNSFNNNKLKSIKATTKPWQSSSQKNRRQEVVLTRLRIGHSNITHGHLMCTPHNPPPECDTCRVQVTIKHILAECTKYNFLRQILFKNPSLEGILSEDIHFSSNAIF